VSSNAYAIRYNLSAITNCTFPCKICTILNYSTCLQCYSSATTQYYFIDPVAQSCVTPSACSSNTFPSYAASACVMCPPQCLTCSSSSACHSCATNYYLLNNSCLTDCPGGYYPVSIQQVCSPCNSVNNTAHCSECISLNVCSNCLYPYNLSPSTKTCVTACLANQIALNSTCFAC
jgi:proprotein convertase subtilisin/kexin type 5